MASPPCRRIGASSIVMEPDFIRTIVCRMDATPTLASPMGRGACTAPADNTLALSSPPWLVLLVEVHKGGGTLASWHAWNLYGYGYGYGQKIMRRVRVWATITRTRTKTRGSLVAAPWPNRSSVENESGGFFPHTPPGIDMSLWMSSKNWEKKNYFFQTL